MLSEEWKQRMILAIRRMGEDDLIMFEKLVLRLATSPQGLQQRVSSFDILARKQANKLK